MPFRVIEVQFQTNVGTYEGDLRRAGASTEAFAGRVAATSGQASGAVAGLTGSIGRTAQAADQAGQSVAKSTDNMHRGFSRAALAGSLMSGNLAEIGRVAAGFFAGQLFVKATDAIVHGFASVVQAGTTMQETLTKTGFAFGDGAQIIIATSDDMAKKFGTNKQTFIDTADSIGLIGQAAGLSNPAAAAFGAEMTKLAADITSFFDLPGGMADAANAIRSGLTGQERPLRQYGVLIDVAATKAEALKLGLTQVGMEMTQQQAVMARAALITAGFVKAEGDLDRTHESLANRIRAASGHWHNFAATIGLDVQPAILAVLNASGSLSSKLGTAFGPSLEGAGHVLSGLGTAALGVGRDLGAVAGGMASLAGAITLPALGGTVGLLGNLANEAAHNQVVIDALTVVIASRFVPALLIQAQALGLVTTARIAESYGAIREAVADAAGAMITSAASAESAGSGMLRMAQFAIMGSTSYGVQAAAAEADAAAMAQLAAAEEAEAAAAEANAAAHLASAAGLQAGLMGEGLGGVAAVGAGGASAAAGLGAATAGAGAASGALTELEVAGTGAAAAETEVAAASSGMGGALGTALGPIGLTIGVLTVLGRNYMQTGQDVKNFIDQAKQGKNLASESGLQAYIAQLHDLQTATDQGDYNNNPSWIEKKLGELGHDPAIAQSEEFQKAGSEIEKANAELATYSDNVTKSAAATGLSKDAVVALAQAHGVDLVNGGQASIALLVQFAQAAKDATTQTTGLVNGVLQLSKMQEGIAGNLKSFDLLGDAMKATKKAATSTGQTEEDKQVKLAQAYLGVEHAQQQVFTSRRALDNLEHGGLERELAGQERDLASAYDGVLRAENGVIDAEQKLEDLRRNAASGRTLEEARMALQRAQLRKDQADLAAEQAKTKANYADAVGIPQEVKSTHGDLTGALLDQKDAAFGVEDATLALSRAQGDNGSIARDVASAEQDVAAAHRDVAGSQDAVAANQQKLNDMMNGGQTAELARATLDWRDALQGVVTAQNAVVDAMKKATTSSDPADKPKSSLAEYMANLKDSTGKTKDYYGDLATISARGGNDILEALTSLGADGTQVVHDLARSSIADFTNMHTEISRYAVLTSESFKSSFIQNLTETKNVSGMLTDQMIDYIASTTGTGADRVSEIMQGWSSDVVDSVNAVLADVGAPLIAKTSSTEFHANIAKAQTGVAYYVDPSTIATGAYHYTGGSPFAQGGIDPHITHSPTILYGERETGGEAFIPRFGNPSKMKEVMAQAASWYGMQVIPMAAGGVKMPAPPNFVGHGLLTTGASALTGHAWPFVVDWLAQQEMKSLLSGAGAGSPAGIFPTGGSIGSGWKGITGYLDSVHVPYTATSTTGGTHVKGSYHYQGKAVDLVGKGGTSMRDIFNALSAPGGPGGPVKGINELFYDPAGYYYDSGKYRSGQIGGHSDHVHAATFRDGGVSLYDNGGWLMPGKMGYNASGQAERVLSGRETAAALASQQAALQNAQTMAQLRTELSTMVARLTQGGGGGGGRTYNGPLVEVTVNVPAGVITDVPTFTQAVDKRLQPFGQQIIDAITEEGRSRG